jgi:hypothetical protein
MKDTTSKSLEISALMNVTNEETARPYSLSMDRWHQFLKILRRAPHHKPRLARLLAERSVLE